MQVAVLADSHDNIDALSYWIDYYNNLEADVLLHAGDLISPFTVSELVDFDGPVHVVFGNNDGDRQTLREQAEGTNVKFYNPTSQIELEGGLVCMSHKPSSLPAPEETEAELLIHGHTHLREWSTQETVPVANPGEAGGWLSGTSSSLIVDINETVVDHQFNLIPSP